jgi:hypothetical protein
VIRHNQFTKNFNRTRNAYCWQSTASKAQVFFAGARIRWWVSTASSHRTRKRSRADLTGFSEKDSPCETDAVSSPPSTAVFWRRFNLLVWCLSFSLSHPVARESCRHQQRGPPRARPSHGNCNGVSDPLPTLSSPRASATVLS